MKPTQAVLDILADMANDAGFYGAAHQIRAGQRPGDNLVFIAKNMCRNGQASAACLLLSAAYKAGIVRMVDLRQAEAVRDKYKGPARTMGEAVNIMDI